jgi:hypothetical protein
MEAIEFACVLTEITKSLNIELDSDLVGKIFEIYEHSYENYTLLELMGLVRNAGHEITCDWNKKALVQLIKEKNLDIPERREEMQLSEWRHYRIRKSLDVLEVRSTLDTMKSKTLEFYDGSIIQDPSGQIYLLKFINKEYISDDEIGIVMYFKNMETKEEIEMYAEDFVWSLDNEDVTILQDRNNDKFMNEEQKEKWTNHVRWM